MLLILLGIAVFFGGGYLIQGTSNSYFTPQVAGLVFIAIAIEISIIISVIARTGKIIIKIPFNPHTRPPKLKAGIKGYTESILNRMTNTPYWLYLGVTFLGGSLFLNVISLLGVGGVMLALRNGPFTIENYRWAIAFAEFGTILFVLGMIVVSIVYMVESMHYLTGKKNTIFNNSPTNDKNT